MRTRVGIIGLVLATFVAGGLSAFAADLSRDFPVSGENPKPGIVLLSPLDYQVFQRTTRLDGKILVSGRVETPCNRVQVRVVGESLKGPLPDKWVSVPIEKSTGGFTKEINSTAGGWYKVEVWAMRGKEAVASATVQRVGVGEVFVGAGQSNSTNCGDTRIQETSGMVSSFSGSYWQLANDPQPGVHDNSVDGSFWPAFGDEMYARYHVPIGVAATGYAGTSVNQWQPDGELFQWTMTRIHQLGKMGFRALLWHQGESDTAMDAKEYAQKLTNIVKSSKAAAGWEFPWFIAQATYHNPNELSFPAIRDAQKGIWTSGVALEGPDTDTLVGDLRDAKGLGIHLSPKGLHAHGRLWADNVGAYLDSVLK